MDTDLFFDEYYKKIKKAESEIHCKPVANGFDKFFIGTTVVFLILYVVALIFSEVYIAILLAVSSMVLVIYLGLKNSYGINYEAALRNRKHYQHGRYLFIKEMLSQYKIEDNESIDKLTERLEENKDKYKYGKVLTLAVKSGFGLISAILSFVSFKMFFEEISKKTIEKLFESKKVLSELKKLGSTLMEEWPALIIDIVLIVILIIELCFFWHAIIKPIVWKRYYYHEEMIRDLKAYKLFRNYHESYENYQVEEESLKGKKPIFFKRIWKWILNGLTKERHSPFKKGKVQKKNK